jgi:TonB family protein
MTRRTPARSGLFLLIGLFVLGGSPRGARADALEKMARILATPSSAKVTHTITSRSSLPFHTKRPTRREEVVTVGEGRPGGDWAVRFLQALRLPGALQVVRDTCPLHDLEDTDRARSDSTRVFVDIQGEGGSVKCELRHAAGRLVLKDDSLGVFAELPLGDRGPAVLALLREALPGEGELAGIPATIATDIPVAPCRSGTSFAGWQWVELLPEALLKVPPKYPDAARDAGVQGVVQLHALIDQSGRVTQTVVAHSVPGLDEAAIRAVEQWRFRPAMADGHMVKVWVTIPVKFNLR